MKKNELLSGIGAVLGQGGDPGFLLAVVPVAETDGFNWTHAVEQALRLSHQRDEHGEPLDPRAARLSLEDLEDMLCEHVLGLVLSAPQLADAAPEKHVRGIFCLFGQDGGRPSVLLTGPRVEGVPRDALGKVEEAVWFDAVTGAPVPLADCIERAMEVTETLKGRGGITPLSGGEVGLA